jgi:ABC-type branched-subunit amino acid transport system ATPase component
MSELLHLDRVSVRFGGVAALSEVSFGVDEAAIAALIGPNGAGKTTCFNVISGLQRVDAGTIRFAGADLTRRAAHRRPGLGRTFQITQLFGGMTARENVLVGLMPARASELFAAGAHTPRIARQERAAIDAAEALLAAFGLASVADRAAGTLSLGQQRLLELTRAVASRPKLLMLDEAASGMSPAEITTLAEHVRRLRREGATILLVEHNMRFVNALAEQLIVLNYGAVIFDGTLADGIRHPDVVAAYLGRRA